MKSAKGTNVSAAAEMQSRKMLTSPAVGQFEKTIRVGVSSDILRLFSHSLYASPHKAIEELVVNSYDADAGSVAVVAPGNPSKRDIVWVADDGAGMGIDDLERLWWIGHSPKKSEKITDKGRQIIGHFGIGKLATYLLGDELIYITKPGGSKAYYVIASDFTEFETNEADDDTGEESGLREVQKVPLTIRRFSEAQARQALSPLLANALPFELFGANARPSWTVVAVTSINETGRKIRVGQLKWVLRTLLPHSPEFTLWLNGRPVPSAKLDLRPIEEWVIGNEDSAAPLAGWTAEPTIPAVRRRGIGEIRGTVAVYEDVLTGEKEKASGLGRSHGFFIRVKERVINARDPLFGIRALSHATFERFRADVHADWLDPKLLATREAVEEHADVQKLRDYLLLKFNAARTAYEEWLEKKNQSESLESRFGAARVGFGQIAILDASRRAARDGETLFYTIWPSGSDVPEMVDEITADIAAGASLVKHAIVIQNGVGNPLVQFDLSDRTVRINADHPFFVNFANIAKARRPLELIAAAEVFTEAYVADTGAGSTEVRLAMKRRDGLLRQLVSTAQRPSIEIAEELLEYADSPQELSNAVRATLEGLGFAVSLATGQRLAGTAEAKWDEGAGIPKILRLTYSVPAEVDAKSVRHAEKQLAAVGADFGLLIGSRVEPLPATSIAIVSPEELRELILVASTTRLSYKNLYAYLESASSGRLKEWVKTASDLNERAVPIAAILETVWRLQRERPERVAIGSVPLANQRLRHFLARDVEEYLRSLVRLVGPLLTVGENHVTLSASPEEIIKRLQAVIANLPERYREAPMLRDISRAGAA